MLILLFVDDCLADGETNDVEWFFDILATRFDCKDTEYITPETPQDYLGMNVLTDHDYFYMFMSSYIVNACRIMNIEGKGPKTPMTDPIDHDSPPLTPPEKKQFMTGLGMLGWLCQTVRCDVSYRRGPQIPP